MGEVDLDDVRAFVRVAERESLTAAARVLGVTKSTVSRRIQRLEDTLGLPLLARTANRVRLTDYGQMFLERCAPALAEVENAALVLRGLQGQPTGLLRVTMPEGLGNAADVTSIMLDFQAAHPGVSIEVFATHRRVDLVEDGLDIAIRPVGTQPEGYDSGLHTQLLGGIWTSLYAKADSRRPSSLEAAVAKLRVVHTGMTGRQLDFESVRGGKRRMTIDPTFRTNSVGQVLQAAMVGASVALLPRFQAAPWVDSGRLVQVCEEWSVPIGALGLIWPASRHLSPRVRMFIDFFSEHARSRGLVGPSSR